MTIQKKIKNILSRLLALENGGGSQSSIIELHPTIQYDGDMEFDDAEVSAVKSAILGGKKVSVHLVIVSGGDDEEVKARYVANQIVTQGSLFSIEFLSVRENNAISNLSIVSNPNGSLSAYTHLIGSQS